jgi:hypothetical protein
MSVEWTDLGLNQPGIYCSGGANGSPLAANEDINGKSEEDAQTKCM